MKYFIFYLLLFFVGSISGQTLYNEAFQLSKLQQKESNNWLSKNIPAREYVLYPDDEQVTSVITGSSGRYVIIENTKVIQYGFYESNGSTIYFQDQKSKAATVYQFMPSDSSEWNLYNYDYNSKEEFLYTLKPNSVDAKQSDQLYVDYLFELDEESLQYALTNDLESFGLGIFYGPGSHHRYIRFYSTGNERRTRGLDPTTQDSLRNNEIAKNSYQLGFFLTTKIGKRFLFESGLILSKEGFKSNRVQENPVSSFNLDYTFNYVDVPLTFRIYPINKAFKLYAKFGVVPKFYTGNTITKTTYDQENNILSKEESSFSQGQFVNLNMSGIVGLGLEYNIFSNAFIYVQPTYQAMFKAFASQQFVKRYLHSQNIQIGIKWNLSE